MSEEYDSITSEIEQWIGQQHLFFVATAPLSADGHINTSPKGLDSFRILDPNQVAYIDLTGSGAETIAHLRENGRIVFMFCAFDGPPNIVRLYGTGQVHRCGSETFNRLIKSFPETPGVRAIITANLSRVTTSCGYAVPKYTFDEDRDTLLKWEIQKGEAGVREFQAKHNRQSLDGLPALD